MGIPSVTKAVVEIVPEHVLGDKLNLHAFIVDYMSHASLHDCYVYSVLFLFNARSGCPSGGVPHRTSLAVVGTPTALGVIGLHPTFAHVGSTSTPGSAARRASRWYRT